MAYTEKYVSVAGGGTHDGTSEANAWTLAEAIAAAAGGNRVNVKAGTYTLGADITLPNGATENPIQWRGYNSTIGDLLTVGRATLTGALTVTNFPVINGTTLYRVTAGTNNQIQNISFTTGVNNSTVTSVASTNFYRCKFANTHTTGAAVRGLTGGTTYAGVVDCDAVIASSHASAIAINLERNCCIGCRIWNSATTASTQVGLAVNVVGASAFANIIFNFGHGIAVSGSATAVVRNSISNCVNGFLLGDSGVVILENVCNALSGYLFLGTANSGNPLIIRNASTAPTSGRIDSSGAGSVIEEIEAIVLSGDPFTNSGAGDFTLNSTSGAGALCLNASKIFGDGNLGADLGAVQTLPTAAAIATATWARVGRSLTV